MKNRTNIHIDDELVKAVIRRYGLASKTQAVDLALRRLAGEPMTREEAMAMEGARVIADIPPDQSPRAS